MKDDTERSCSQLPEASGSHAINDRICRPRLTRAEAATTTRVVIDFSQAHLWDASTIAALDAVEEKYRRHGATVEITGLNVASRAMRARMSGRLGGGH